MGGNVWQWLEPLSLTSFSSHRVLRGGAWGSTAGVLAASNASSSFPSNDSTWNNGFRVATIPEPSTFVLTAFGIVGLAAWGWRRRVEFVGHAPRA